MTTKPNVKITNRRHADKDNDVVTVEGGDSGYMRSPCPGCPWRRANAGSFPAQAFRESAPTAYDMNTHEFGCHESGVERPRTCAGFLLRGSDHNMATRLKAATGKVDFDKVHVEDEAALFDSYREMAVANGVDPDDPVLRPCRP